MVVASQNLLKEVKVNFMQSDGGLADVHSFNGFRAILSGPAGGVVGYALTCYNFEGHYVQRTEGKVDEEISTAPRLDDEDAAEEVTHGRMPLIGLDMGGTSTDVSRYDGHLEHVFENTTAGVIVQAPQLDINTVAAGGGSMLFFRAGMFVVGPESAGAHPGPVCYRKGGPLTITDANLFLGRIQASAFPHVS